ncbi:MAG: IS66 family transposase [Coriobacteriia bacterium]|nr:IS66 family transposase [Coriobacteriia bacterium]
MAKKADIPKPKIETLPEALDVIEALTLENKLLREELALERAKRFGRSSESRVQASQQQFVFNEAESLVAKDQTAEEPDIEQVVKEHRRRPKGKRDADLSVFDVNRIDYELPDDERSCPKCSGRLHEIGTDVRRELIYNPATYHVNELHTHVYSCRHCQTHSDSTPVIRADSPKALIPNSIASASLVSQILADKYERHLPLYRQEAAFVSDGLSLSRQTISNWVIYTSETWLTVVYDAIRKRLVVSHDVLCADETTVQVINEEGRAARQKSYMWLYRTGADALHPLVCYEYKPTRSASHPKDFLEEFKTGYLHSDGYRGYHSLGSGITVVGCWAHMRRYFTNALKPANKSSENMLLAEEGLAYCDKLFLLEREFANLDFTERYQRRKELSEPIALSFFKWAEQVKALPRSLVGKAIHYAKEQRIWLMNVFLDGRLELSNNRAERSIKPFVLGRKNWTFSNTPRGADASAVIYSIVETAKENDLRVHDYLEYLLEKRKRLILTT